MRITKDSLKHSLASPDCTCNVHGLASDIQLEPKYSTALIALGLSRIWAMTHSRSCRNDVQHGACPELEWIAIFLTATIHTDCGSRSISILNLVTYGFIATHALGIHGGQNRDASIHIIRSEERRVGK